MWHSPQRSDPIRAWPGSDSDSEEEVLWLEVDDGEDAMEEL